MHRSPSSWSIRNLGFRVAIGMPRRKGEDSNFGSRLTALGEARGLTQVELAEAVGATQRSISYYENDDGILASSVVVVLAQALHLSADESLGLKSPPTPAVVPRRNGESGERNGS